MDSLKNVTRLWQDASRNERVSELSALKSSCPFKCKLLHSSFPLRFPFKVKVVPTQLCFLGGPESRTVYAAVNQSHSGVRSSRSTQSCLNRFPLLSVLPRLPLFLPQLFQLRNRPKQAPYKRCSQGWMLYFRLASFPQPCLIGPPLVRAAVVCVICSLWVLPPHHPI